MDGYLVDPGGLDDADAALAESASQSRAALAALTGSAGPVLAAAWQGEAATAFRAGFEHWLAGVASMLAALDDLAVALGASSTRYAATEVAVRTAIGRAAT